MCRSLVYPSKRDLEQKRRAYRGENHSNEWNDFHHSQRAELGVPANEDSDAEIVVNEFILSHNLNGELSSESEI